MASNNNILICTDLDRTLLPNGSQSESSNARPLFHELVNHPDIYLAYVSGRDKQLLLDAIEQYKLPIPDFAITDVGSTIYATNHDGWQIWDKWHTEIAKDWGQYQQQTLAKLLKDITKLQLQEPDKQGKYKLSYYADEKTETTRLFHDINTRLNPHHIKANLIWSIDETSHTGLLDILPQSANKLHAIRFLMAEKGFTNKQVVFSGDSGNDLEVLCSDLQATLVANATIEVREQAIIQAIDNNFESLLYCAKGEFMGMNGNYAAGILEGVAHYLPHTLNLLKSK